jgi:CRISPR-associated endonuclease/helicase Cas3
LLDFDHCFEALTGNAPFPWQRVLFRRFLANDVPTRCDIPTGLGKTSVLSVWLIALAEHATGATRGTFPRRLAYVVNRRTVVDQATREAEGLLTQLANPSLAEFWASLRSLRVQDARGLAHLESPLAISTLRGQFADNGTWRADPARPAILVGTVDMIGSRLLFSGYGAGFKTKPLHAGFLGQDTLMVHDEAHLEPAFQDLLVGIESEQRRVASVRRDGFGRLCVMALTATSRGEVSLRPSSVLHLDEEDRRQEIVKQRFFAKKAITFHLAEATKLAERVAELALDRETSGKAILIFLRRVEDVQKVIRKLPKGSAATLTGTIRGLERERLRSDPIFARFDPKSPLESSKVGEGTVYLVCTSAGEVGVDISADHLVCDLTPFDSMAQRLGRVNRFGGGDARVDVVHEAINKRTSESGDDAENTAQDDEHTTENAETDKKPNAFEIARQRTLALLETLPKVAAGLDASPAALQELSEERRLAAFTPMPEIRPATDVLFDAWALTSILDRLPGRPPVADWLHGIAEWEPPETRVAWRTEVEADRVTASSHPRELLELYPLKPQEILRDTSKRVLKELTQIVKRAGEAPAWVVDEQGGVEVTTLARIVEGKDVGIGRATVLLPPSIGGLNENGGLDGSEEQREDGAYDVADLWLDEKSRPRRVRLEVANDGETPEQREAHRGMRLVLNIPRRHDAEEDASSEASWRWYVEHSSAEDQGSRTAPRLQTLAFHLGSAEHFAREIVTALGLAEPEASAIIWAGRFHDLGKERRLWQRSIGNFHPTKTLAKSEGRGGGRMLTRYRHELGSLFDIEREPEFQKMSEASKEIARHVIAAHHGRARPCFPDAEILDPSHSDAACRALVRDIPSRFARLQRSYGRWGLAYLESLLRAADVLASLQVEAVEDAQPLEAAE